MKAPTRWVELAGAVNVRDLGGLATTDGNVTRFGRVLRSDNLQNLQHTDVRLLLGDFVLKNVIDLRSGPEVELEGPGPLARIPTVTVHHLSLFAEGGRRTDVAADTPAPADVAAAEPATGGSPAGMDVDIDKVLPWQERRDIGTGHERSVNHYLGYLRDRGDSVVAALRVMSRTDGAALVHCAAGKDRTGVVCALALDAIGVHREAIVDDYELTGQRLEAIVARLRASSTYAADLAGRPADSHLPHRAIMEGFLGTVDERFGGTRSLLGAHGWDDDDTENLRHRLLA